MTANEQNVKGWNRTLDWCKARPLLGWYVAIVATLNLVELTTGALTGLLQLIGAG